VTGAAFRFVVALLPVLYVALGAIGSERRPIRAALAWGTFVLHGALFLLVAGETLVFPLVIPGAALSALGLAIFLVYGVVEWRSRVRSLAPWVFGGVFVIQLVATALGFASPSRAPGGNPLFVVHVITIIVSVATLLLSGFFGVMYLVMERQMRAQNFGALFERLPKLSELAAMNRRAASAGFLMMTVGFNLGIWLAHDSSLPGFSYRDPIVVITMATWVVFGIIGLSRWVRALTGRRVALAAVCGLVLLVLSIVISVVPGLSFHRFS
jgi:ABC-type uncharacterized transport system permease subunit